MPKKIELEDAADCSPSLLGQLIGLDVGASVSRATRLDGDEATKDAIVAANADLRNGVAAAVNRAKRKTDNTYIVETGEFRGRSLDVNVVVVVTRTQ